MTEHLQTNDRPNIQTYALCTFTFSLQTFTIFFQINAFINVYYNFFDVYHIYVFNYVICCDAEKPISNFRLCVVHQSQRSERWVSSLLATSSPTVWEGEAMSAQL